IHQKHADKIKNIELIEKYIDGELDDEKTNLFQNMLKNNPALAEEVNLRNEVNNAVKESDIIDLREQLEKIHKSFENNPKKGIVISIFKKKIFRPICAIFILIILSGALIYIFNINSISNDKLFSMYYQPYEATLIIRSGDDMDIMFKQAIQKYEDKDYESALSLFTQLESGIMVNYYSGITNMELENYNEAINLFQYIINHNNNLFVQQAEWYLGLCYLKTHQNEKAIEIFKKIKKDDNSYYKKNVNKILKYIN
ncbi:MAG: tetratricopeptide repeat protein, partial [Bacteroidales bacterium]|nr:tetratricopeptide repeat protein [Bacteroidales bacterium]